MIARSIHTFLFVCIVAPVLAHAQKACFGAAARTDAERNARVWRQPDPSYDPVLGYAASEGPRRGTPPVDAAGLARPIVCSANPDKTPGKGTTPKFHCSVAGVTDKDGDPIRYKVKPHFKGQSRDKRNGEIYGEFLASRFSKALGFFADDEWVADVTCADCEKSLTSKFQGAPWNPFQPAAGIELPLGKGIDVNCNDKDSASLDSALPKLLAGGAPRAEIDAFKLWLAFIDHGDTKSDNHKYACLKARKVGNALVCEPGQSVYYISDMGSTFGYSKDSEKKARLAAWASRADPINARNGRCTTTAKGVGDTSVSEAGRSLLAGQLQRLIDEEKANGLITRIFRVSRNSERDREPEAWAAEFIRKAGAIINARCSN